MKKAVSVLALLILLAGCAGDHKELDRTMALRAKLLAASGCSFDAVITADYGDKTCSFAVSCTSDGQGNVTFEVAEPESIAGITGTISGEGGKLTFDDTALAFELLAEGRLSPVSAPWVLVHTLHQGYLTACSETDSGLVLSINDRYEENALNLSVYLGDDDLPTGAEIFCEGSRILSLTVANFSFL